MPWKKVWNLTSASRCTVAGKKAIINPAQKAMAPRNNKFLAVNKVAERIRHL
jgi:hypothetical protein